MSAGDLPNPPEQQVSRAHASLTRPGLSDWFIRHPIGTTLLTCGIVLLGIVAFPLLPVAPLPEAELPTLQINANFPGASPETMASAVATPLEVQLSSVPGIAEMTSSSSLGSTSITLQFVLTKDIDVAAQEVQAAINAAAGRLPADLPNLPTWRKVNPNDSPVLVVRMNSKLMTLTELSDVAETVIARQLSQIDGVAEIPINGQRKPAMRIQAAPEKLASLGLTLADLRQSIRAASVNQAKGALFGDSRVSTLQTNDQIFTTQDYDGLIVAYRDNAPVFLRDVAKVTFGAENEYVQSWQNGEPGIMFIIRRQPGANIVATADRIRDALPRLRELLPAHVELEVINDRTRTIRASLHEVEITLIVTVLLVVVVMGAFLRQLSATAIVASVLAVALIATVGVMHLLGFSLNNLTLVALVVAVGFVVDDAIVVVENIHRHLEAGESPLDAARRGAAEIGFTVVSISFSLIAAFVPLLFMGGVVGRLFREFAVTMTVAILISVVASLTLAPMLSARFMKPLKHKAGSQGLSQRMIAHYDRGLQWALSHQRAVLISFGATVAVAVLGYIVIPKGFFPLQDTAFIIGASKGADDVSYGDMVAKHKAIAAIIAKDPAVQGVAHVVGASFANPNLASGRIFIVMKDRGDRDVSSEEFIERMRPQVSHIPGIQLFMRTTQDINLGAGGGRAQYLYVLKGAESGALSEWSRKLSDQLRGSEQLRDVSDDLQLGAAITRLNIDRAAAARFGLQAADIDQVLYDAFGQRQISEYQTETNQYKIILEIDPSQRGRAESLQNFYLRSPLTQQMVPLSAIARVEPPKSGPLVITHDGMFPSVTISFNLARGVALGDAVELIEQAQSGMSMPASITGTFRGTAQEFQKSLATQPLLILGALIAVYIILGVLYESFVHPLTILSTLPSAGIGAVLALWLAQQDFSIMALIGVVLLIGIVKKNGILMVDFALERQRKHGLTPLAAIHEACLVRFRPIIMTTLAAMLGAIPLMLGFGTGSELRQPLGVAVFGGLIISQILTLFSTPVIYLALDRMFHREEKRAQPAAPALPEPA